MTSDSSVLPSTGAESKIEAAPQTSQSSGESNRARELSRTLRIDGFDLVQVIRVGDWAIYQKAKMNWSGYEVVRIRAHDGFTKAGKTFPPAETYPSSEKWGVDGFSCSNYKNALRKLAEASSGDQKKATVDEA